MAEEADITKGKKGKGTRRAGVVTEHRSRRVVVYQNRNKPILSDVAGAVPHFDDDDDDDLTPGHAEAAAHTAAMADQTKGAMGNAHDPGGRSPADARVSPPLTAGHQASSTGDHGAAMASDPMCQPGPRELAWRHPDLRQQSVSFNDVIARLRTVNGDNQNGDRDITYTAGEVGLNLFNARGAAGAYPGMQPVGHIPQRPDYHPARQSATPSTGSHGLADPQSHAVAMKASEAREMLKRHMFPGSGAR